MSNFAASALKARTSIAICKKEISNVEQAGHFKRASRTQHERRLVGPASPRPHHEGQQRREVHEFMGMWPLKPDADLVGLTKALEPRGPFWDAPGKTFSEATTMLGLIRTARWFVGTSTEFGPTLYFVSQFDSSLEKYFDDFVLNGKDNLETIWGTCIGCPTGPDATARDIVQYIARGQIKTLACYDALPSLNIGQIQKMADWYAEDAEVPARGLPPATATSRTRSTPSSASWPSPTSSCGAAPTSTPTSPTSGSSPTFPSGWA